MFAGLPGIGVGTLFYVLMAILMPIRELPRLVRGKSSLAAWRLIALQLFYATGIIVTVMFAENVLLWILADGSRIHPLSPTTWVHAELGARANGSILAAPITASLLMLSGVLLTVEALRIVHGRLRVKPVDAVEIGDANRRRPAVEESLEVG
ncbi:MAG TPA: hypothetical protein VNT81_01305 [Vicinamibacterales bacterium]|nr:hypothetical protein [Vicinamibacterales bacterium]